MTEDLQQHAQRMASLSQLTGGLIHDINNLLTVILGNLEALNDLPTLQADSSGVPLLTAALRATRRGAELTHKLLAYSRQQAFTPVPVDVDALLRTLAQMLERTLDPRVRLALLVTPACPPCLADPVLLESALLNVSLNARDAMPDGGSLVLAAVPCAALPEGCAGAAGGDRRAGYVAISVRDNGTGMTAEVRERALEPFFTTKPAGRGTGLGLSTTLGFVRQSRGALTIDSAPGQGTCVTLYLPRERRAAPRPAAPTAVQAARLRGLDVMVIDDDLEVLGIVLAALRQLGCDARAYVSAEHALGALERESTPRLLLTDIALGPGLLGTELVRRVAARWPGVALLMMSGEAPDPHEVDLARVGLLLKPFARETLAAAMLRALDARRDQPSVK